MFHKAAPRGNLFPYAVELDRRYNLKKDEVYQLLDGMFGKADFAEYGRMWAESPIDHFAFRREEDCEAFAFAASFLVEENKWYQEGFTINFP